jgi:DNA-binding NarL/FixJ family response regulator
VESPELYEVPGTGLTRQNSSLTHPWQSARDEQASELSELHAECVLLADRHHALSEGIRGLLESAFKRIFLVADEASLLEGVGMLRPTVVVVDLTFRAGDLTGLLRDLKARSPASKVLLLSVHDEASVLRTAIAAGADGVVLKRSIATDLLAAVDEVLAGRQFASASVAR